MKRKTQIQYDILKKIDIPNGNEKVQSLGIKEPKDKIVEQAISQVLEPILIAKFHNNSNDFINKEVQQLVKVC